MGAGQRKEDYLTSRSETANASIHGTPCRQSPAARTPRSTVEPCRSRDIHAHKDKKTTLVLLDKGLERSARKRRLPARFLRQLGSSRGGVRVGSGFACPSERCSTLPCDDRCQPTAVVIRRSSAGPPYHQHHPRRVHCLASKEAQTAALACPAFRSSADRQRRSLSAHLSCCPWGQDQEGNTTIDVGSSHRGSGDLLLWPTKGLCCF